MSHFTSIWLPNFLLYLGLYFSNPDSDQGKLWQNRCADRQTKKCHLCTLGPPVVKHSLLENPELRWTFSWFPNSNLHLVMEHLWFLLNVLIKTSLSIECGGFLWPRLATMPAPDCQVGCAASVQSFSDCSAWFRLKVSNCHKTHKREWIEEKGKLKSYCWMRPTWDEQYWLWT